MKHVPVCAFNASTSSSTHRPCLGIKIQAVLVSFVTANQRDLAIFSFRFKRLNVYDIKRNVFHVTKQLILTKNHFTMTYNLNLNLKNRICRHYFYLEN